MISKTGKTLSSEIKTHIPTFKMMTPIYTTIGNTSKETNRKLIRHN